jgi:hypothetical protein
MCVSLHPAELSATRLMGHVATVDGETRHVIGYQNVAKNHHHGANAMVLPIPSAGELDESNFLDTTHAPHILKDMVEATTLRGRTFGGGRGTSKGAPRMRVFDHGIYSIALGRDVTKDALDEAMTRVPANRRPDLNWDVLSVYPELYPGWWLAFCCFDNRQAAQGTPLLYHYRPLDEFTLFLPALDAHDGQRPRTGRRVEVDHDILVGVDGGATVRYQDSLGALAPYLPTQVVRANVSDGVLPNGDFLVSTRDIETGPDTNGHVPLRRSYTSGRFTLERTIPA